MLRTIAVAAGLMTVLSGCAHMQSRGIGYAGDGQRLFVWRSEYSAGMGNSRGLCAQGALTARANATEVDARVSDRALAAFTPGAVTGDSADLANIATRHSETVMLTNATTAQTAYANLAFFYICQIALNEDVTGEQIVQMWSTANTAAVALGQTGGDTQTLDARIEGRRLRGLGDTPEDTEQEGGTVAGAMVPLEAGIGRNDD